VLAVGRAAYLGVVVRTAAATIDNHGLAEVGANRFKHCEGVHVHGIEAAAAVAGEFPAVEMGANLIGHSRYLLSHDSSKEKLG
tara:strand:- start:257 stop:505 length:249 start_codon:yes stop_codon:yes gene_type:complete